MLRRFLFANFKLVYKLSQWTRHRFTAFGKMILFIIPIAGIFGFDTRTTLSFQIFSITLILLLTSISLSILFRGKFFIERKLPEYGTVNTPLYYSCVIKNENRTAKKGLILIDNLQDGFPSIDEYSNFSDASDKLHNRVDRFIGYPRLINAIRKNRGASIKPVRINFISEKNTTEEHIKLVPIRRGYLYFEKLKLAKIDPLGLIQSQKSYINKDKLLILPKLYNTPPIRFHGKRTHQLGGINNASSVGDSQEFVSLRDYRPGDPIRSIHWKSFAKRNHPVVKEYDDEFFIRYGLVLDTYFNNSSEDIFEEAVSIAASFMTAQKEQDTLLDLIFIDTNTYRFTSGRGLGNNESILEVLACVKPSHNSNMNDMKIMLKKYKHECSGLICILLKLDDERKELIEELSKFNIPVKVLVVVDSDKHNFHKNSSEIVINTVNITNIQQDLDNL